MNEKKLLEWLKVKAAEPLKEEELANWRCEIHEDAGSATRVGWWNGRAEAFREVIAELEAEKKPE